MTRLALLDSSYMEEGTHAQKHALIFFWSNRFVSHLFSMDLARSGLFARMFAHAVSSCFLAIYSCKSAIISCPTSPLSIAALAVLTNMFSSTASFLLHALFVASVWYIATPSQLNAMGYFNAIRPQRSVSSPHHAPVANPFISSKIRLGIPIADVHTGGSPNAADLK